MAVAEPTLEFETELHNSGARYVIGCDEVGRGAIAGPVGVGVCLVDAAVGAHPEGLRDSKLLSEKRREELAPRAALWARFSAVGLATAEEVDAVGIIAALGIAGKRALASLHQAGANVRDSVILLDGSHDWLSPSLATPLRVRTRVKADRDCASVSAASVLAKVHRDRLMIAADLAHPGYGWASNKGYGSVAHFDAIAALGATPLHRHTWLRSATPTILDPGASGGGETGASGNGIVNAVHASSLLAENA
ncbi:RNase HII [Glaciihabitans tibetensis]|uniref:Ribonuclease n=1 Tax=Glaciihabitans tibetensis TaxID=1266600 RepID=A0A2T0VI99_9MICO|nr:ribonuclease HII [Glaciihabitans tibetensis]PRY69942.1 RNase HII [Glaciihabitans tibetensis]